MSNVVPLDAHNNVLFSDDDTVQNLFDGTRFLENLNFYMKDAKIKIGELENRAGVSLGYVSRLAKEKATARPSVEFIMAAAKILGVAVSTLLYADLSGVTADELFINSFIEKLTTDTNNDKLTWVTETPEDFSRIGLCDFRDHRLFRDVPQEDHYEEYIFPSRAYGKSTKISGNCYNIRLKNNSYLYIMRVKSGNPDAVPTDKETIELWMTTPNESDEFLCTTQGDSRYKRIIAELYNSINSWTKRPHYKESVKAAIEAFMNDDWGENTVEEDDGLPFE